MAVDLTAQRLRELLRYDPSSGEFIWRVNRQGHAKAGGVAGSPDPSGYVRIKVAQRLYLAHRLAWFYMTGAWPNDQIDHIDTMRSNNRWLNLREVDGHLNAQNRRHAARTSRTGVLGVRPSASGKRFQGVIRIDGKSVTLGHFATPEEAHAVYVEAKRRLHPGNTL